MIGNAAAGSIFAGFQSMGALGALTMPWAAGSVVVGAGGYVAYKWVTSDPDLRLKLFLHRIVVDQEFQNNFWGQAKPSL